VPGPLTSGDRGGIPCQDPRQFKFAIICMRCTSKFATMQEARIHFQDCPFGKPIDVMCGHCELRTSLWPAMCAHLNQSGMQKQVACKPEYRMAPPQRVEFTQGVQPLQSPASPVAMTVLGHSACAGPGEREWKAPASPTLSPSRQVARSERLAQLRAILLHWERKHPGRTGLRGAGAMMPIIPWSQLQDGVTACQPAPRGAPEIWPPPARIHRVPTRHRWRKRVPGRVRNLRDRSPSSVEYHRE